MRRFEFGKRAGALSLTALLLLLSACGGTGGKQTTKTTGKDGSADTRNDTAKVEVAKGDALPILPEVQTYKAMVIQTSPLKAAKDRKPVIEAEKATNIHLEWSEIPSSGWDEKINLLFSTKSVPDLIIGDAKVSTNYQQLLTLDDYLKDYAPNVVKFLEERPEYKTALRAPDGKIHSFPVGDESYLNKVDAKMWINTEWLKNLGLEMPTTTEELEKVLYAFKTQDPNKNNKNDEIPMTFRNIWGWAQGGETFFGQFGVIENTAHVLVDKNKKVLFSPQQEGYKKALQWFNKLYKDGVLDSEAFIMSADEYAVRDGGKDIVGVLAGYRPSEVGANNGDGDRYQCLPAIKGPDGEQMVGFNNILRTDGYSINKDAKNPEALVRLYDYINSSVQLKLEWGRGQEGEFWQWSKNEKGEKAPMFIQRTADEWKKFGYTSRAEYRSAESFAGQTPGLYTIGLDKMKLRDPKEPFDYAAKGVEMWEPYEVYGLPAGASTPENSERRAVLLTDIDNYLLKFVANAVMNGLDDAAWQNHLKTLESLKVDEYTKLCQEYTDSVSK